MKSIDPQLLDLLYTIDKIVGLRDSFHVLSAYRSPASNPWLRMSHSESRERSACTSKGRPSMCAFLGGAASRDGAPPATDLQWDEEWVIYSGFVHLDPRACADLVSGS